MRHRTDAAYIMSSLSRTLYTGVTNNLERRIFEHKERRQGSFTARYNVNRLVYFEEFSDINQAIKPEKEIKSLTRRRKIRSIESMNAQWRDLSQAWKAAEQESEIPRAAAFLVRTSQTR
jgi:putative endonuclease